MTYTLHYAPDNASLVIRMFLYEIGVVFECALIDRKAQEQTSLEYLRLNPNGLIPVLETKDGPIFETAAILLWLSETHSAGLPLPNSGGRTNALKWLFFLSNTVHSNLRILFYPEKYIDPAHGAQLRTGMSILMKSHLSVLDKEVDANPWFLGNEPSVIDIYLCVMMRWMALYPKNETDWFDINAYPNLNRIAAKLETRQSILQAAVEEGLGETVFTKPSFANPPEGSAT